MNEINQRPPKRQKIQYLSDDSQHCANVHPAPERWYNFHEVEEILREKDRVFQYEKNILIQEYEVKLLEQYDAFSKYCSDYFSQNNKLQDYVS